MKRILIAVLLPVSVILLSSAIAVGAGGAEKAGKASGKELYKATCRSCHGPDSPNGEYAPIDLIQEQWERFFDEEYTGVHEDVTDESRAGEKVLDRITPEMLRKIRKFCNDGAADSEHPMTCG